MKQMRFWRVLVVAAMVCGCGGAGKPKLVTGEDPSKPGDEVVGEEVAEPQQDVTDKEQTEPQDDVSVPDDVIMPPLDIGTDGCVPDCEGKMCGDDGCGGSCGVCVPGVPCNPDGICADCVPNCAGKECGDDDCGGLCGQCQIGNACLDGMCYHEDIPDCTGKVCGSDGLGGICGACPCADCSPEQIQCVDGQCVAEDVLDCAGIFACLEDCGQQPNCGAKCFSQAPLGQQQAAEAVYECIDAVDYYSCYDLPESQQDACWMEKQQLCEEPFVECWHGDLSCKDMYLCVIDCGDYDYDCQGDCMGEGDVPAQYLWNDLNDCLYENGYYDCPEWDDQCYEEIWPLCQPIFQECVHGEMSCGQVLECASACPPMDDMCGYECYFNGSVEAQALYSDFLTCIYSVCGGGGSGPMCWQKAIQGDCAEIYQDCTAP